MILIIFRTLTCNYLRTHPQHKVLGGFYQGKWISSAWPEELQLLNDKTLSMAFLELYPIVVAAVL